MTTITRDNIANRRYRWYSYRGSGSGGGGGQNGHMRFCVAVLVVIFLLSQKFILFDKNVTTSSLGDTLTALEQAAARGAAVLPMGESSSKSLLLSSNNNDQQDEEEVVTIAYAISLIKCGDFQSNIHGMSDAATVLRHSIHQNSIRNAASKSKYDYKLYAIVHKQAATCTQRLQDAGYEIVVRDTPIHIDDVQDPVLRKHMPKAWCCGHDEFIKLYAYTLPHPIVVHVDVDFAITQPMDDLFDAMLLYHHKDSERGKAARARIPLERPIITDDNIINKWPDQVDAFLTRDWAQVMPGRKPGYQAGFLVVRPSQQVFDEIVHTIKTAKYVDGFSRDNGWGGKGYGGFVGAAAMQGLLAYYYDEIRPQNVVELNQCRYNHMGMDVLYRAAPSFQPRHPKVGKCRNDQETCEDCQITPLEKIYSIHYTQCRKPWNCVGEGSSTRKDRKVIPENNVILEHCMELLKLWHSYRTDLEQQLLQLTGDETIKTEGQSGDYKKDVFQGHCKEFGGDNYLPIAGKDETRQRIPELYEKKTAATA